MGVVKVDHDLLFFAEASQLAYGDGQRSHREWVSLAFVDIGATSTQAHILKRGDSILVAFRGTERGMRDWLTDLNGWLSRHPKGGKVHGGMLRAWQSAKDSIIAVLEEHNPDEVYLTGHSLGGGLAEIAAVDLSSDYWVGCITYGAPKVGNVRFAEIFQELVDSWVRVANACDIVTYLGPRWLTHPCKAYRLWSFPPCHAISRYIRLLI